MSVSVYLDTNVFIAAYESKDERAEAILSVFDAIAGSALPAVTSEITLAELLPKPLSLGQRALVDFYIDLFAAPGLFSVVPVTAAVLMESAHLRAHAPATKLPDAIHIATARLQGCKAFLSDDRRLSPLFGLGLVRLSSRSLDELRQLGS